jgi:hypothetical protein
MISMPKSSPEKLAAALKANLKRRKEAKAASPPQTGPGNGAEPPKTPLKKSD